MIPSIIFLSSILHFRLALSELNTEDFLRLSLVSFPLGAEALGGSSTIARWSLSSAATAERLVGAEVGGTAAKLGMSWVDRVCLRRAASCQGWEGIEVNPVSEGIELHLASWRSVRVSELVQEGREEKKK